MRIIICAIFVLLSSPAFADAHVSLPLDEQGIHNGAPYRFKVPANWNGTLLVYVRGTQRTVDPVGLNPLVAVAGLPPALSAARAEALEKLLLADGYAFAATALPDDAGAWFVREGMHDALAITHLFNGRVGKPDRTLLWSRSQGTIVGLRYAERYRTYDASIAGCAVGAGTPRTWDLTLDLLLAWKAAFGFPPNWGTPADIRDDISFAQDVVPVIVQNLTNPAKLGLFEFVRLVSRLPSQGFYPAPGSPLEASWLLSDMFFATEIRAEVEREAKGRIVQNVDHVYTLTLQEKAYLALLGVDADSLLAVMNGADSRYVAEKHARHYTERYAEYTGDLRMPVITLHTTTDGLVLPSHESAYRETVEAAGNSDLLVQLFADSVGHCTFTPEQWYEAVTAASTWLDSGVRPGPDQFPHFLQNFSPPPFPNP